MAYTIADMDDFSVQRMDPNRVRVRRTKRKPWRKMFRPGRERWTGRSFDVPIDVRGANNAQPRAQGGNLGEFNETDSSNWNIVDSDFTSFSVKVECNTENHRFDDETRALRHMIRIMGNAEDSWNWNLDLNLMCSADGDRAVIEHIYDGSGANEDAVTTTNPAWIVIDRTSTVGSLGRLREGDIVAIHAAAADSVRIYAKVQVIRAGWSLGSIDRKDCALVTFTGVTQSSRTLGDNAADANFTNVVAGDYIRTQGARIASSVSLQPFGIDAVGAGTITDLYGINQTTAANAFALPNIYDVSEAPSVGMIDSALESHRYHFDPEDIPAVLRIHPSIWREIMEIEESKLRVDRASNLKADNPLIQWGWKDWVYSWEGKDIGLWIDPCQNYTTIDLMPTDIWEEYFPPNVPTGDEWNRDPKSGSLWSMIRTSPSGAGNTAATMVYEADRVHHMALLCRHPRKWLRMINVTAKAYTGS